MKKQEEATHEDPLSSMADRLKDSARLLREVAARMARAAAEQKQHTERLRRINSALQSSLEPEEMVIEPRFTYLEYIEFVNAKEFHRFNRLPPVSQEEIENVDWDDLTGQLQMAS